MFFFHAIHPSPARAGVAWIVGRLRWAACYAEGGAGARYNSVWSKFIWYSLIACACATASFALGLLGVV
jgi:hypothetical protein